MFTFEQLKKYHPKLESFGENITCDFWEDLYQIFKKRMEQENANKHPEASCQLGGNRDFSGNCPYCGNPAHDMGKVNQIPTQNRDFCEHNISPKESCHKCHVEAYLNATKTSDD